MSSDQQQTPSPKATITKVDECFMTAACMSATAGVILRHGGPFGAAVVRDGMPISCAHNTVLYNKDPTCHAEVNAIRHAVRHLGRSELSDCVLYTSCEPCPMCWGAIMASGLKVMYVGADRYCAAKFGFDDKAFYDEFAGPESGSMMPVNPAKTEEDEKWMAKVGRGDLLCSLLILSFCSLPLIPTSLSSRPLVNSLVIVSPVAPTVVTLWTLPWFGLSEWLPSLSVRMS